jgi:hypothetical protein
MLSGSSPGYVSHIKIFTFRIAFWVISLSFEFQAAKIRCFYYDTRLCSGNFVPLPPKLIQYVNLRNRNSGSRHSDLYRMGAVQRVLGQTAEPFVLGMVRDFTGHPAALRNDSGVCLL